MQFDERQLAARYRASNRTLATLAIAVLLNGAFVALYGEWVGPFEQATLLLLLTGCVQGLQTGWNGAHYAVGVNVKDRSTVVAVVTAFSALVTVTSLFLGHSVNPSQLLLMGGLLVMLASPVIGLSARRWVDRRAERAGGGAE